MQVLTVAASPGEAGRQTSTIFADQWAAAHTCDGGRCVLPGSWPHVVSTPLPFHLAPWLLGKSLLVSLLPCCVNPTPYSPFVRHRPRP